MKKSCSPVSVNGWGVLLLLAALPFSVFSQTDQPANSPGTSPDRPLLRITQGDIPADSTVLQTAADTIQDTVGLTINLLGTYTILPEGVPGEAENRVDIRVFRPEGESGLTVEMESRSAEDKKKNVTLRESTASVMGLFDLAEEMARRYLSVLMEREIRFVPFRVVNTGEVQGQVTVLIDGNSAPMEVGEPIKIPQGIYPVVIQQQRIFKKLTLLEEQASLIAPEDGSPPAEVTVEFSIPALTAKEEEAIRQARWSLAQTRAKDWQARKKLLSLLTLLQLNPSSEQYKETASTLKETTAWTWGQTEEEIQEEINTVTKMFADPREPTMAVLQANREKARWFNYSDLRAYGSAGLFAFLEGSMSDGTKLFPAVTAGAHYRFLGPLAAGGGILTLFHEQIPFHIQGFMPFPYLSAAYHQNRDTVHRVDLSSYAWFIPYVLAGYTLNYKNFTLSLYGYYDWDMDYMAAAVSLGYSLRL